MWIFKSPITISCWCDVWVSALLTISSLLFPSHFTFANVMGFSSWNLYRQLLSALKAYEMFCSDHTMLLWEARISLRMTSKSKSSPECFHWGKLVNRYCGLTNFTKDLKDMKWFWHFHLQYSFLMFQLCCLSLEKVESLPLFTAKVAL